jgi:hypothetical protein
VNPPAFDDDLGFFQRVEQFPVEKLIAHLCSVMPELPAGVEHGQAFAGVELNRSQMLNNLFRRIPFLGHDSDLLVAVQSNIHPGPNLPGQVTLPQVSMAVIRTAKQAQLPGVSMNTLRHTFISRLVQAGRPLPEVAALAGHRDIKMTLRYAHLAPSHLRAGIQALEERTLRHEAGPGLSTDARVTPVSQDFGGNA